MSSPRPRAVAKAAPPDSVASAGETPTLDLSITSGGNRKPAKTKVLERMVVEPVSNQRSANADIARKITTYHLFSR